jgi:hypothetical protein
MQCYVCYVGVGVDLQEIVMTMTHIGFPGHHDLYSVVGSQTNTGDVLLKSYYNDGTCRLHSATVVAYTHRFYSIFFVKKCRKKCIIINYYGNAILIACGTSH